MSSDSADADGADNCQACGLEAEYCGGDGLAFACPHCRTAWYCSKECLQWDWNRSGGHKGDCSRDNMQQQHQQQVRLTMNNNGGAATLNVNDTPALIEDHVNAQDNDEMMAEYDEEEIIEVYESEESSECSEDSSVYHGSAMTLPTSLLLSPSATASKKMLATLGSTLMARSAMTAALDESESESSMASTDVEAIFLADHPSSDNGDNQKQQQYRPQNVIKIAPPDPYAYKETVEEQSHAATVSVKDRKKAWQQTILSHQEQHSEALMTTSPMSSPPSASKQKLGIFAETTESPAMTMQLPYHLTGEAENSFHFTDDNDLLNSDEDDDNDDLALRAIQEDDEPSEEPDMEGSWRVREPFAIQPREPLDLPETVAEADHESFATANSSSNASFHHQHQHSTFGLGVDDLVQEIIRQTNASAPGGRNRGANYQSPDGNHNDNSSSEMSENASDSSMEGASVQQYHHSLPPHLCNVARQQGGDQESLDPSYASYTVDGDDHDENDDSSTMLNDESAGNFGNFFNDEDDDNGNNMMEDYESDRRSVEGQLDDDDENGTSRTDDTDLLAAIPPSTHERRPVYGGLDDRSVETSGGGSEDLSFFTRSHEKTDGLESNGKADSPSKPTSLLGSMLSKVAARQHPWSSQPPFPLGNARNKEAETPHADFDADVVDCPPDTRHANERQTEVVAAEVAAKAEKSDDRALDAKNKRLELTSPSAGSPKKNSLRSLTAFRKSYINGTDSKSLTTFRQIYQDDESLSSAIVEVSTDAEQSTKASTSGYSVHSALDASSRSVTSDSQSFEEAFVCHNGNQTLADKTDQAFATDLQREVDGRYVPSSANVSQTNASAQDVNALYSPVIVRVSEYSRVAESLQPMAGFGIIPQLDGSTTSDSEESNDQMSALLESEAENSAVPLQTSSPADNLSLTRANRGGGCIDAGPCLLPDCLLSPSDGKLFSEEDSVSDQCVWTGENPQQGDNLKNHDFSPIRFPIYSKKSDLLAQSALDNCEDDEIDLAEATATVSAAVFRLAGASQQSFTVIDNYASASYEGFMQESFNARLRSTQAIEPSLKHTLPVPSVSVAKPEYKSRAFPPSLNQPVLTSSGFKDDLTSSNLTPAGDARISLKSPPSGHLAIAASAGPKINPVPVLKPILKPSLVSVPGGATTMRAEIAPGESLDKKTPSASSKKVPLKSTQDRITNGSENDDLVGLSESSADMEGDRMSDGRQSLASMSKERGTNALLKSKRCIWIGMLVLLLVAIVCSIGLGIGLCRSSRSGDSNMATTVQPTPANPVLQPSQSPKARTDAPSFMTPPTDTSGFTEQELQLFDMIAPQVTDGGQSMGVAGSPQNRAVLWLASSSSLDSLSETRLMQRYALAVFYYSTAGDTWTDSSRWLDEESECSWFSRSISPCDGDENIIELSLGFNQVGGSIAPEIGLLTSLQSLALSGGTTIAIGGTLPSEMGLLTAMTSLSLRDNALQGSLPVTLAMLTSLVFLDMSSNAFSGVLDGVFGQWSSLRELDFSANNFTGSVPDLASLAGLQRLNLGKNRFIGSMSDSVGQLENLRELSISQNMITGLSEMLGLLPSLSILSAGENRISGTLSSLLGASASLRALVLRSNSFTGSIPSEIGQGSSLRYLDLSFNKFDGTIPTEIGELGDLIDLQLQSNLLTGVVPSELSSLNRLGLIRIDDNDIAGTLPEDVCNVFSASLPVFYLDCGGSGPKVACPPGPCCTYCCSKDGAGGSTCTCLYEGTGFDFLC